MPRYTKYAQLRTPLGPEADDVPGDLQLLANGIDPLLNLQATDEADRDARYGDAPVGTLVSLTERGLLQWRGLDGWVTVVRRAVRIEGALTPSSDWSPSTNVLQVMPNGFAKLYLTFLYQGAAAISVPSTGNISNAVIGSFDAQYAPLTLGAPMGTTTTGRMTAGFADITGSVYLTAVAPGGDIQPGETLQLVGSWSL